MGRRMRFMCFRQMQPQWVKKLDKVGKRRGRLRLPGSQKGDQHPFLPTLPVQGLGKMAGTHVGWEGYMPLRETLYSTWHQHPVPWSLWWPFRAKVRREAHGAPHTFGETANVTWAPEGVEEPNTRAVARLRLRSPLDHKSQSDKDMSNGHQLLNTQNNRA